MLRRRQSEMRVVGKTHRRQDRTSAFGVAQHFFAVVELDEIAQPAQRYLGIVEQFLILNFTVPPAPELSASPHPALHRPFPEQSGLSDVPGAELDVSE